MWFVRVDIEYRVSLRSKDIAVCRLYLRREGPKYVFYQDIYRKSDDKLCTRGKVESVATVNGRATRGDELAEYFKDYLS